MKTHTHSILTSVTLLILLLTPLSAASESGTIQARVQSIPNAIVLSWNAPENITVLTYYIHFATASLLEDATEIYALDTASDVPSYVLRDLHDRELKSGDTLYIGITVLDDKGSETTLRHQAVANVIVPPSSLHAAADAPMKLLNAIALSNTQVKLEFSREVNLPDDIASLFTVTQEDTNDTFAVSAAENNGRIVILTLEPIVPLKRYAIEVASGLKGVNKEPLDEEKRSAVFIGRGTPAVSPTSVSSSSKAAEPSSSSDSSTSTSSSSTSSSTSSSSSISSSTSSSSSISSSSSSSSSPPPPPKPKPQIDSTPPEDATDLTLKKILQDDGLYTVKLNWKKSANTAKDLATYNLYESKNRGSSFVGPTAIASLATSATLTNVPPGTLTAKLTAKDKTGNESEGTEETIVLPETGAISMLVLSIIGAGGYSIFGRKKKPRN